MMKHPAEPRIHYGWVIILAGILNLFACLGLGRFALGMLLPSMGRNLSLSYSQMGIISTGNLIGYLCGVLICGALVSRFSPRIIIFIGLLTVGCSMMLVSNLSHYLSISACYLATGIGSALANISMMGLLAPWFSAQIRGRIAGLIIAGNGLGIMLSGSLIPILNTANGENGWRNAWLLLGSFIILAAMVCGSLIKNSPAEKNLTHMGPSSSGNVNTAKPIATAAATWRLVVHLGGIYLIFGFTYIIYATFIVTTLVEEMGYSEAAAGRLWVLVGIFSLFSGTIFGGLSDRIGRRKGLMIVFALQCSAYLLVGLQLSGIWVYLSISLFGLALWSVPSIMAATASDLFPPGKVTAAFGHITFFFGVGQIIGPSLAGFLAELSGTFSSTFIFSAVLTGSTIFLIKSLKTP